MKQVRKETKNGKVLVLKPWKRKQNRENERHFQYFLFSELHACSRSSGASSLRATKSLIFDPKYGLGMSRVTSRVRGMRVCNRIYLTTPSSLWGPGRHYTGREPCWKKRDGTPSSSSSSSSFCWRITVPKKLFRTDADNSAETFYPAVIHGHHYWLMVSALCHKEGNSRLRSYHGGFGWVLQLLFVSCLVTTCWDILKGSVGKGWCAQTEEIRSMLILAVIEYRSLAYKNM